MAFGLSYALLIFAGPLDALSVLWPAHDRGIKLVLVHLPPAAEKALRSTDFISHRGRQSCLNWITPWSGARTRSS